MTRALALLVLLLATAAPAVAAPTPYGTDDAGGFRNVLPPGADGVGNAADLAAYTATGAYPEHWTDQQPLYDGLLYASPTLTRAQVDDFFKDATFGVKEGDVESTVSPRDGVTIVRDAGYGVPHVYGDTRGDVMFGAGYAGAQDRLFLMDVLRHTGRAELSSFVGGSAGNRAMDRTQWSLAPYTEADLQRQIDLADDVYGDAGRQLQTDLTQYVAGINAYISETRLDPTKLPAEYAAFGKTGPEEWLETDVIATASLIGGIFGKGGGNELRSAPDDAGLREALRAQVRAARRGWTSAPRTTPRRRPPSTKARFPYQTGSPFAKRGLALPDRGSVEFTPVAPPPEGRAADFSSFGATLHALRELAAPRLQLGDGLRQALRHRASARRARPAGRLLRPADPDGARPPRRRDRRPRRRVPRRQPDHPARPRHRLRLERDHRRHRQRRHVRRGALPGRLPLPLQGRLPGDGEARALQRLAAERRRLDAGGLGDADRLPDGPRHRLRARQGRRQEGRLRARPHDVLPRGRLGARLLLPQPAELREEPGDVPQRRQGHQLRLQLGLHQLRAHGLPAVRLVPEARQGHVAGLPDPRHGQVRLARLRPRALPR